MGLSGSLKSAQFTYVTHSASPGTAVLKKAFQYTLLTRGADVRRQPGITIRSSVNRLSKDVNFTIDGRSNTPRVGERVQITDPFDGNRLLFDGPVIGFTSSIDDEDPLDGSTLTHQARAVSPAWLLNKYRPFGRYVSVSCSDIVKDLFARYAPLFTTEYIQLNLAKLTVEFDGTQDFQSCLNTLADAIGGGHWYVDDSWRAHFFHQLGTDATIVSVLRAGPMTAPTVVEGTAIPIAFTFQIGFYAFALTAVYDNGVESAIGTWSPFVALQGTNQINFSNVPTGAAIGSHAVVSRRLYYKFIGPSGLAQPFTDIAQFCEIPDNATTSFTTYFKATGASVATITTIDPATDLPFVPDVAPAAGSTGIVGASQGTSALFYPQAPLIGEHSAVTYTRGPWAFRVVNIFADGTWSQPSPPSNTIDLDGTNSARLNNVPVGDPVNGVSVVARAIFASQGSKTSRSLSEVVADLEKSRAAGTLVNDYGSIIGYADAQTLQSLSKVPTSYTALANVIGFSDLNVLLQGALVDPDWSPEHTSMWYLITDNTTTSVDVGPGTGGAAFVMPVSGNSLETQWPNNDGPNPEDSLPIPDDVTDTAATLLRPSPTVDVDHSQTRNRVMVRGAGTVMTTAASVGAKTLTVADTSVFSKHGGLLMAGFQKRRYIGLSTPAGPGNIILQVALTEQLETGAPVCLFYEANDLQSQKEIGLIELDKNGKPTDGIHEYMISDPSLRTPFMLFMRAYAELEQYSKPIKTIRYSCRDPKSRVGATVHVDLARPPVFGDFMIQEVSVDQIHDDSDVLLPRYNVTASSIRFDLNDLLLKIIDNAGASQPVQSVSTGGIIETSTVQAAAGATRNVLTLTLSSAQAKNLLSTPLKVIPAPGAGKWIHIVKMISRSIQGASTYDSSQAALLRFGLTTNGTAPGTNNIIRNSSFIRGLISGGDRVTISHGMDSGPESFFDAGTDDVVNKPIILTSTGNALGGNIGDTFTILIEFEILDALVPQSTFTPLA
jgi:hypothetical protein